jgi:hypothetical protein
VKAQPRKAEPVEYEAVLKFVENFARPWLIDNAAEPHLYVRCTVLAEKALSPPTERYPLINNEDLQADYDDEKARPLIDRALHEQDADADAALCEIIFQHLLKGRELPQNLRAFLMVLMRRRFEQPPKRSRGAQHNRFFERNRFIVSMITSLHSNMGMAPTRNRASKNSRPCGCSIVADALTRIGKPTTERAVEEVWINRDVPPE